MNRAEIKGGIAMTLILISMFVFLSMRASKVDDYVLANASNLCPVEDMAGELLLIKCK